jgi:uncharacterized protein
MDAKSSEIKKTIDHLKGYIKMLGENEIPIKTAYLFGSYAKGSYDEWSDIDVLLVSDVFQGVRFLDKEKIRKISLKYNHNISPIPFNTKDFDTTNLFIKEIINTGIQLV